MVKKLEFTRNDRSRRTKFKNRTNSLKKKIEELSILCGIDVGAIIFANDADAHHHHHHGNLQLIVCPGPQHHINFQQLLSLYKEKAAVEASDADNSGDTSSSSSTASSHSQQELGTSCCCYDGLSLHHLNEVVHIVERRIAAVDNKIQFLRRSQGMPLPEDRHAVHCCCRGYDVVDPGCSHHRDLNITLHGTCNCCVLRHSNHHDGVPFTTNLSLL